MSAVFFSFRQFDPILHHKEQQPVPDQQKRRNLQQNDVGKDILNQLGGFGIAEDEKAQFRTEKEYNRSKHQRCAVDRALGIAVGADAQIFKRIGVIFLPLRLLLRPEKAPQNQPCSKAGYGGKCKIPERLRRLCHKHVDKICTNAAIENTAPQQMRSLCRRSDFRSGFSETASPASRHASACSGE